MPEYCETCRQTQKQTGDLKDCDDCEGQCPELMPENREVFHIILGGYTQMRAGGMGIIGFDYLALRYVAQLRGYTMGAGDLRKIQAVEKLILNSPKEGEQ